MSVMSTPDKPPKKQKRKGVPLHVYLPPPLMEVLVACAADHRRKLTQEVVLALEGYLKALGRWPPPEREPSTPPTDSS